MLNDELLPHKVTTRRTRVPAQKHPFVKTGVFTCHGKQKHGSNKWKYLVALGIKWIVETVGHCEKNEAGCVAAANFGQQIIAVTIHRAGA